MNKQKCQKKKIGTLDSATAEESTYRVWNFKNIKNKTHKKVHV